MTIGEKIRTIRKEKGMTQQQLADICGMADSAIRKYESGKVVPKTEMIKRIATALEVPAADFMDRGLRAEAESEAISQIRRRAEEKYREAEERGASAEELGGIAQIISMAEGMLEELSANLEKAQAPDAQAQSAEVRAGAIQQTNGPSEAEQEERAKNTQTLLQLYGDLTLTGQRKVLERIRELMYVPGFRL